MASSSSSGGGGRVGGSQGDTCTDIANAQALAAHYGGQLRYVTAWRQWLVWDGHRWARDTGALADHMAQSTVQRLAMEAQAHLDTCRARLARNPGSARRRGDLSTAHLWRRWTIRSQQDDRIAALLRRVRHHSAVTTRWEALDADPWLLACPNGTLDLRSGKLRAATTRDLITLSTRVDYVPDAQCPQWLAFLRAAMGGAPELLDYLRRLAGYCLTGSVKEDVMTFHYGAGCNGKTTFLQTLARCMGEYAIQAPSRLLFRTRSERHPTELASLYRVRLAVCSEVERGVHLDEAKTKDLTGGERIKARRMYENFWEFDATHKLQIAGNHRFKIVGDDEGIWRRIHTVPWSAVPATPDTDLESRLLTELEGILAWAVQGCREWWCKPKTPDGRGGLLPPPQVTEATAAFRASQDPVSMFVSEFIARSPDSHLRPDDLWAMYHPWALLHPGAPISEREVAKRLRAYGFVYTTVRVGDRTIKAWQGVRAMSAVEKANKIWGVTDVT